MSAYSRHDDPNARDVQGLRGPAAPAEEKIKPVIDGELVYTSVSQIQKYTPEAGGCPSKWYFRYVLGQPDDPPGKGQQRGTEGHKRIEDYLLKGINVLDRLEREGLKYIPAPNTEHPMPVLVEHHIGTLARAELPFAELKADGVPVIGYIDLVDPRQLQNDQLLESRIMGKDGRPLLSQYATPERRGQGTGTLRIVDWKFKKNVELYGSKPWELMDPRYESGIQMIGYAEWARIMFPGVQSALVSHVTFQTGGQPQVVESVATTLPRARHEADGSPVVPIQLDSAKPLWETVTRAAIPGMRRAAKAKSHTEVPKNQQVCHKFRKACPYISTCLDRMARIRAGFSSKAPAPAVVHIQESLMGMLSDMNRAASGKAPVAPPPSAVVQTPAPIQVQSQPVVQITPPPVAAPGRLTAATATPMHDYEVKGVKARFIGKAEMGGQAWGQFMPEAGGTPLIVPLTEEITALALPIVKPPDAPVSNPAAAVPQIPLTADGILASTCALGSKYEVNGQIAEFQGTSREFAFFITTAGPVKLLGTDRVKPLKGEGIATAPPSPVGTPTESGPAQAVPPPQPPALVAEEKPAKKRKLKIEDKSTDAPALPPGHILQTVAPASTAAVELTAAAGVTQYTPPTHSADGTTPYGSMQGVRLYFGCSPVGVVTQTLGPYVDALERELLTKGQLGVHDVRVAQDSTFGFNKWKGYLAELAKEKPPPAGHYIVSGYADERIAVVGETLALRAEPGCVTRGGG